MTSTDEHHAPVEDSITSPAHKLIAMFAAEDLSHCYTGSAPPAKESLAEHDQHSS
ncbi:hypothetical protein H4696_001238 [Amycolatopsis lexingtonensis]|uniref:Uncharacterized protein n=1 Tax=Amycolatopsis lexingtonensis TaxID=218822 RepID=A0ABR9HT91_9PSEU|nr:hypothetical protein [Amycolatopsis lexingtonensis]MBE1494138.1 hypothetical protein [Amycolatopsis lexingtonensis]